MKTYDTEKTPTQARQGNTRQMNMRVLVISTAAIVVLFGLLYLLFQPGMGG